MPTTKPNDRPTLAPAVEAVLGSLRRRIRQYVWLEGCGAAAAWLGAAFWITLAIDWFFEPPAFLRGAALALIAVVLAAVLLRLIGRRAFVPITDANAATVLERRFPQLSDSLLTAVTLAGRPADRSAVNPEMLAQTCRQAADRISDVDLKQVFNPRPLWLSCSAAGLLTLSVAFFAILFPEGFGVWARRALALSDELWPRNTRLEVEGFLGGVEKVARGADLEVVARADAAMPQVPQVVEVRYRTQGGNRGRATMDRRGVAHGPSDRFQEYAYTFRSVLADVHFDVVGGDDRVRDLWIQAVDSPTISAMTLQCELPGYIGRQQPPLPVTGAMQIPIGSRVTIRAEAANKNLVRVQVNGLAGDRPMPVRFLEADDLAADRRGFSCTLESLTQDTTLLFTLTDSDGIRGRDPVRLVLAALPDQPPQVAVQLDGIGTAATPRARIPVVGAVADDYGVGRAWFEYAVDGQKPGTRPIGQFAGRPTNVDLAGTALEMSELAAAPGQKLLLCVKAADLCDLGRGQNVSSSDRWTIEVVTPEQLRLMLESRELVLRQRFERMIQEAAETRDLLARLDFGPPSGQDLRLLRIEGALTNCRKSAPEVLGVAEAFDDIRKQFVNNRIDTEELNGRLQEGIAQPLHAIAQRMLPEFERRLERLRAACDDAGNGPGLRDRARQQADDILLAMQKVRDRMLELESFNEALDLLRSVIRMQDQLRQQTQRRHKQKIRELLDQQPAEGPELPTAEKLAQQQQRIAEKFKHLEDVLLRMAELDAAGDPHRAALLKKAVAQSKERLIAMRLEGLVELLGKDQLSRALKNQAELDQDLRTLLELLLTENRAKRIESEKARIRDYLKRIGGLIKQEKDLQARTAGGDDPERLAGEQEKVAQKTGDLADDVRKNEEKKEDGKGGKEGGGGSPPPQQQDQSQAPAPAQKHLQEARQRMKQAEEKLKQSQRQGAGQQQEEAVRELQMAKAELEEILRQLREEEIERVLAMLESRFRKMLQMQEEVYEGTLRLDRTPSAERTHSHEIEASRLGVKESQIVVEMDKALLLLRDDGSAAAFLESAGQLRDDMQQIVEQLSRAKVGKIAQNLEEDAIAALKEMIEAFRKAQKDRQNKKRPPGPPPSGQPDDPPLVDVLAELRMIRALQMRVNARTARYADMIEGEQAENAELLEAVRQLAERQRRIHRVTRDLQMGKNQ